MKQHHSIFPPAASLACALILMLAACTSDALDELPLSLIHISEPTRP